MFENCKMKGTFFDGCVLRKTCFIKNDMTDAKLENSDATSALFFSCNVTNLSLKNTNILDAKFKDCTDKGIPITTDWLRKHGALNADKAIVFSTVAESNRISLS